MKKRTQITEISVETNERIVVRHARRVLFAWCAECGGRVRVFTPEEAAQVAGVSSRAVYCHIENGTVHFTETPDGKLFVCVNSLLKMT